MKKKLLYLKHQIALTDYRHYICVSITLAFLCVALFVFPYSIWRFIESGRDFGRSLAYLCTDSILPLFGFHVGTVVPSVNSLTKMPFAQNYDFPTTWEGFKAEFIGYWTSFGDKSNFFGYLSAVGKDTFYGVRILVLIIPIILILGLIFYKVLNTPNINYNVDTKPLRIFKRISDKTYRPAKKWINGFVEFLGEHRNYLMIWACIWGFAFNLFSIVLEFLAFFFYFEVSFDVVNIYRQVYKLGYDLLPMLHFVPIIVWGIIGLCIFHWWRRRRGFDNLDHMEMQNRGFINERSIVLMLCGSMGSCKTTIGTDIALSQEVMYRDSQLEIMLECDFMFPYFPWINLENVIKKAMANHYVYNLHTVKCFIRKLRRQYKRRPNSFNLFGYDISRYETTANNGLYISSLWEIITVYAQAYLMYILRSSLIISNYSIRSDNVKNDIGNLPLWDTDFFRRHPDLKESRYAHILDFDTLKLGRKIVADNVDSDCFEFGVISITEIGKERGNQTDQARIKEELKKNPNVATQLNDFFNRMLKMIRHAGTVMNKCFTRVICDEQRPESLGADARELAEIVHIDEVSEMRLCMPFFTLEESLHNFLFKHFVNLYKKYRFLRGDNSLFMYVLKSVIIALHRYYVRTYNQFGYRKADLSVEAGTQDGKLKERNYYLMAKKIYAKRFATDCFSDFFDTRVSRSNIGIDDIPTFRTERATFAEMDKENSYFFRDLCKLLQNEENNKEMRADETPATKKKTKIKGK